MGLNLGILISGRGSNMLNLVNASQRGLINSKIKIVISNNKNSSGIDKAKRKNIKTKIINQKDYESKKDFENALTNTLKNQNVDLVCLAGFMSILSKKFFKGMEQKSDKYSSILTS